MCQPHKIKGQSWKIKIWPIDIENLKKTTVMAFGKECGHYSTPNVRHTLYTAYGRPFPHNSVY